MRALACLLALATLATAQEIRKDRFNDGTSQYQGKIQDIIPYDLDLDGMLDLVVTHTSFSRDASRPATRYISIKWNRPGAPFEGKPDQTWIVPPEAASFLIGNHTEAPGVEIGYLCATGAFAWELKDRQYQLQARRLVLAETLFDVPQEDSLPLWWWPLDLDWDGMTDLLVPQHDCYRLYVQTKPGVYGRVFNLQMKTTSRAEEGGAAWLRVIKSLPRVETRDINGDFRTDVCFIFKDQFLYFLQETEKVNGVEVVSFPQRPSGQFPLAFLQQREKKDQIATAITYLCELNRGGGADFVASYTRGELANVGQIATDYYMYLGNSGRPIQGLAPTWHITLPGVSLNPFIGDLNADGFDDIVVSSFETGTLSNLGKVAFQNVPVDYYVFLFDRKNQSFSAEYDYKETIYVDIDKMNAGGGMPQLRFNGDFDGDGRKDILRMDSDGWLSAAKGIAIKTLVKDAPVEFEKTDMFKLNVDARDDEGKPDPPRGVDVWDFNGDGKADLMFRWSSRIRILMSK